MSPNFDIRFALFLTECWLLMIFLGTLQNVSRVRVQYQICVKINFIQTIIHVVLASQLVTCIHVGVIQVEETAAQWEVSHLCLGVFGAIDGFRFWIFFPSSLEVICTGEITYSNLFRMAIGLSQFFLSVTRLPPQCYLAEI